MLAKTNRFIGKDALKPLFSEGKRLRGQNLQLRYLPNNLNRNRFAVIVSKKVAKRAVDRNRIRRRIYSTLKDYTDNAPHHDLAFVIYDIDFLTLPQPALQQRIEEALDPIFKEN